MTAGDGLPAPCTSSPAPTRMLWRLGPCSSTKTDVSSHLWLPGPPPSRIIVSMCGIHSKPLNPRPELQRPSLIMPGDMAGLLTVPWVGRWVAQGFHLRLKSWPFPSLLWPCQLLCGLFCMTTAFSNESHSFTALTTFIYPHFLRSEKYRLSGPRI